MKNKNLILSAALAAVFSASTAFAEAEVTGKIVHESAKFTTAGTSAVAATAHGKDAFKQETSARIFINGAADELQDGATYHVELNLMKDGKATSNYDSNESYTQRDVLREAYVDSQVGDWSLRTGKQQVVWGTADGMKLLDMINPSDYGEMAQNQMEDSRLPVWMINAETDLEAGGSVQVVVSEPKENVFAGLNRGTDTGVRSNGAIPTPGMLAADIANVGTDTGNAFLMMGPDTITGAENGFLNIVPDLGSVAGGFGTAFMPLGTAAAASAGLSGMSYSGIADDLSTPTVNEGMKDGMSDLLSAFTVDGFTVMRDQTTRETFDTVINATGAAGSDGVPDSATLQQLSDQFLTMQMGKALANGTYINAAPTIADFKTVYVWDALAVDPSGASITGKPKYGEFRDLNFAAMVAGMACQDSNMSSMLVLTCDPTGATSQTDFDKVAGLMTGEQVLNGFADAYGSNLSSFSDGNANSAFEYMTNTGFRTFDTFVNARSQYVYNMPSSTDVDFAIKTSQATKNGVNYSLNFSNSYDKNPIINLSWRNDTGEVLKQTVVDAPLTMAGAPVINGTYIALTDAAGMPYGGGASVAMGTDRSAILTFEQAVVRSNNFGGSFDTAIETEGLGPVVIRGEALYTTGGKQPVMSKTKLSTGDLVGALSMQDADRFKFVLGADITALTNMLISAQYITDRNLDFIDNADAYTTDYATMHLSNGFNKAIEDKQYYSLFFSKPFGASGEHRWNNITMLEEGVGGNGKWNRLDAEFSIDDDTQATVEYNKYWGNANTQFGQLEKSSNIQVGVKYSF